MKKSSKKTVRLKIEKQDLIKEVNLGLDGNSYRAIRLSRVKYYGNEYNFIDIRFYQRGYDDDGNEVFFPTTKGVQMKEDIFNQLFNEYFTNTVTKFLK